MSDKTTLLQSLSKLKKAGKLHYWRGTIEIPETELHAICDEIQAEHEQAIAATLGRPKAKSHPYGYERDTGAYDCTRCKCGCINDISAAYCNDCGGEIEIDESAEKEYYDGYSKHTVFAKKHDDGSLEFGGKRYIAATLGNERELIDLAHNAWSMALCAMQGMPIPAEWGDAVERGLREHGIDVDGELAAFEVIDDER